MQPKVTVIIPTYNSEKTVRQTVESAMQQTEKNLQILLLDDCSTDSTANVLHALAKEDNRIQVIIGTQNQGVAKVRNYGMELAQGAFIAFLDSDDIWVQDKLERQLADMEKRGLDLSYTAYFFINEDGERTGNRYAVPDTLNYRTLLRENVIGCSTAVMRKEAISELYMRSEYLHEDYVFWLELLQKGCKARGINLPLMGYRILANSRSADKGRAAVERWRIYREFLKLPRCKAFTLFAVYGARGIKKHFNGS